MLRGSLLAAALFPLLALGSGAGSLRDGRIAYVHVGDGNRFQIYTVTATGAQRQPLTSSRRYSSFEPSYAPRGKRIAFVRSFKQFDLWTMNADGSGLKRLTSTGGEDEASPSWSPDGETIAFAVEKPAAQQGIWLLRRDGGERRQLTTGADDHPSWSPDGSTIAFSRAGAIWVVAASGGNPTQLTFPGVDSEGQPYVDAEPAWSPGGSRILFVSDRGDPAESADQLDLWTIQPDGSGIAQITHTPSRDERDAAWSPDGRRIVYSGSGTFHGASSSQLYVSNANGTKRRVLTHACGECAYVNAEPSWRPVP
jgi:Tol biopolymer transport system component